MTINAILAHDKNYGIGYENGLPWPRNDADMKWFQDCTRGHVVVMGRKTWESLNYKKLPGRINVVVTRSRFESGQIPDKICFGPMPEILVNLQQEHPHLKIWVIGGAEIYEQAIPFCDNLYITEFNEGYKVDTYIDSNLFHGFYKKATKQGKELCTFNILSRI